jgi:HNH endonuclease
MDFLNFERFAQSPEPVLLALWSKVDVCHHAAPCRDCCWLWHGPCDTRGYGNFTIPKLYRARRNHVSRAHRVMWEVTYGPIPSLLNVLHDCPAGDNPRCVNPSHLWVGTFKENTQDALRKGRMATGNRQGAATHPEAVRRGSQLPHARLTEDAILPIFQAVSAGATPIDIAAHQGVTPSAMYYVLRRQSWRHVDVPEALLARVPSATQRKGQRGAVHHAARVTPERAARIATESQKGDSLKQRALRHGLAKSTIATIVNGTHWTSHPDVP